MKFLLSIPCQVIVVVLVAVTVSSFVGKPLKPLMSALSIAPTSADDRAASTPAISASVSPRPFNALPIVIAFASAFATFLFWHLYRFYRSELAIGQVLRAGGSVESTDGWTGVMRYVLSDVTVSFSDRRLPNAKLPQLHQIHNLTRLNLAHSGVTPKSLAAIVYCRFLQEIDLRYNALSRETLLNFHRKTTARMLHSSEQ